MLDCDVSAEGCSFPQRCGCQLSTWCRTYHAALHVCVFAKNVLLAVASSFSVNQIHEYIEKRAQQIELSSSPQVTRLFSTFLDAFKVLRSRETCLDLRTPHLQKSTCIKSKMTSLF